MAAFDEIDVRKIVRDEIAKSNVTVIIDKAAAQRIEDVLKEAMPRFTDAVLAEVAKRSAGGAQR